MGPLVGPLVGQRSLSSVLCVVHDSTNSQSGDCETPGSSLRAWECIGVHSTVERSAWAEFWGGGVGGFGERPGGNL